MGSRIGLLRERTTRQGRRGWSLYPLSGPARGSAVVRGDGLLELCGELLDAARAAGADHAEAIVTAERSADTHIENGEIHTAQTAEETTFGLRVLANGTFR